MNKNRIINKMTKSKTDTLNMDEIIYLLNMLQEKFNILEVILPDKEFEIYLLDRSHICYDSFLMTYKNKFTGSIYKRWMLFSMLPCFDLLVCNKYFVFLHEIGHCVFNIIMPEDRIALSIFKEIATIVGLSVIEDENKLGELFADFFAAVSLKDTQYSYFNPFKEVLSEKILELFELYFKMIMNEKNIETNKMINQNTFLN